MMQFNSAILSGSLLVAEIYLPFSWLVQGAEL